MLIGTRGSLLATTQSGHVRDALAVFGYEAALHIVTTDGDVNLGPVERIGVGVFTQALREALYQGECQVAVHSMKDLPTAPDARFHLVVPTRADARDCLVAKDGHTLATLPEGAVIGTGAPRRIAQVLSLRPDVTCVPMRGNIDTRMGKVTHGEVDAVVLAYAGLLRVGKQAHATEVFDPEVFVPAPAQGALAIECRTDDERSVTALNTIADGDAFALASAERTVLRRLEAGCTAPVAAYATGVAGDLTLTAAVIAPDGSKILKASARGTVPAVVGIEVSDALFAQGAAEILR